MELVYDFSVVGGKKEARVLGLSNKNKENRPIEINIPDKVRGYIVTTVDKCAFRFVNIKKLKLPKNLKTIEPMAFEGCGISELILPEGVKYIGDKAFFFNEIIELRLSENLIELGKYSFACNLIKKLHINKKLKRIKRNTFSENKLKKVVIPSNIESVGEFSFFDNKIESLVIENGLKEIKFSAFEGSCFEFLDIPGTVRLIDSYSLGCEELKAVIIRKGSLLTLKEKAFVGGNFDLYLMRGVEVNKKGEKVVIEGAKTIYLDENRLMSDCCGLDSSNENFVGVEDFTADKIRILIELKSIFN